MDIDRAVKNEIRDFQFRDESGIDRSWRGPLTKQNMKKWSDVMERETPFFPLTQCKGFSKKKLLI